MYWQIFLFKTLAFEIHLILGIDRGSVYTGYFNKDFLTLRLYLKFGLHRIPVYSGSVKTGFAVQSRPELQNL
jgi:hypothetical protein